MSGPEVKDETAELENVLKWGSVYDEMCKETGASISEQDPILNWSGYTDTFSRRPHIMTHRKEYKDLGIATGQIAAHELAKVCNDKENDVVLSIGVTLYFPSAEYLLGCMRFVVTGTRAGGYAIFGVIQSKRHMLAFRAHVETFQSLRRADATAAAVLYVAKQTASGEELSYFNDLQKL